MDSKHLSILIAVIGIGVIYMYWQLYQKNQLLEQQLYYLHNHIQKLNNQEEPITIDLDEDNQTEQINYGYDEEDDDDEEEPDGVEQHEDNIMEIEEEVTPAEDIVITKTSHCQHILQSGKNKGSSCGKPTTENGFCKNHCTLVPEPLST